LVLDFQKRNFELLRAREQHEKGYPPTWESAQTQAFKAVLEAPSLASREQRNALLDSMLMGSIASAQKVS
jgi:hypothetical protein